MKKILVLSLIFLLVLQPVTFPATAFADEIDDELLSETVYSDTEDNLDEVLLDNFDSSSEVADLIEDKSSAAEFNTLNDENIDENGADDNSGEDVDQDDNREPIDEKFIKDGQVYISRIYNKDDEEFVEIYNSGGDIITNHISVEFFIDNLASPPSVVNLGRGIFRAKSSILIRYVKNFETSDKRFDGYYLTNNLIRSRFILRVNIGDYSQALCTFNECDESIDFINTSLNQNQLIETCREYEGHDNDCKDGDKYYRRVPLGDDQIQTHYGGFIPEEVEPEDDSEVPAIIQPKTPKNTCEAIRLNEIAANADGQFIEITNQSNGAADLLGCRIKTNRSKTRQYEFDEIELQPSEIYSFEVADSDLLLTKTTKGEVFLLNEDDEEVDSVAYENLKKDTSWSAFVGEEWRQTYTPTPNEMNIYTQYPPCPVGQERNLVTGRCRNIPVETEPAPCLPDQYRNPETGRCRKYATLASANLVPCKEGQYRHPETNRCRKIPTETELAPCKEGYERNPETNRCRKVVTNASASHSVEEIDLSEKQFTGWLIISGIGVVAIGVIVWEWRQELWLVALRVKNKIKYRSSRK